MDDLISRQAAIDIAKELIITINGYEQHNQAVNNYSAKIMQLPPAQPEPNYDEWCDDCKEYDTERHCCPRWNKVIRQTLADIHPEQRTGKWVFKNDLAAIPTGYYECSECKIGRLMYEENFCPNCGAKMEGAGNETD